MPKFFFDVHDGISMCDDVGYELPDLEAAKQQAVIFSGDLLRDSGSQFWQGDEWRMDVRDERDLILFSLHFLAVTAPVLNGNGAPRRTIDPVS